MENNDEDINWKTRYPDDLGDREDLSAVNCATLLRNNKQMMSNMLKGDSWKSKDFFILILILQIIVYFVVYANIPTARIVLCFLYLMFIPGMVILRLLKPWDLDLVEKVFFSVVLSFAFLMFVGVIVNDIAKLAIAEPLSLNLLILSINTAILIMSLVVARRDESHFSLTPYLRRSKSLLVILLSVSLFLLGSYGIFMVNVSGNSFLLLLLVLAICVVISLVSLSEKIIPSNLYPFILLVIFICALIFLGSSYSLITRYITGNGDQWFEYYVFRFTETSRFWNSAAPPISFGSTLYLSAYSLPSITILPTIFSTITGMDDSLLFKFLYPFSVSFMALGVYKLCQTQTDNKTAFLATFFLITISVGKGLGPSRQEIAQLFYVSLFLLLLKKGIPNFKRSFLFIICSVGLVMSHYSLSYLFLLTVLIALPIFVILGYRKRREVSIYHIEIPISLVLIFLTIAFSWYIFVGSSAIFGYFSTDVQTVISSFNQFFIPSSRGTALEGLGVVPTPTIFSQISAGLFILTEILIFVGFLTLLASKNKISKFSTEYKVFASLDMAIIGANILLPRLADTFLMSRFYQTTLILLAPLAVLGGKWILGLVPKPNLKKLSGVILVFAVFVPLFLFQTNFVFEVAKVQSWSLPLSMYRWNDLYLYSYITTTQEVDGAQWIPKYANMTNVFIYSDIVSQSNVLLSYGMILPGRIFYLSNVSTPTTSNDLAYLANVGMMSEIFNNSQIVPILANQNKIYSNGECEIYAGCNP
jgi:uncharacterized membrane protein